MTHLIWIFILIYSASSKVDIKQSSANKKLIASLPDGHYEVVHPFQIRDKNERIGIDTRNYFLKASEHYQHVTIVIRSNQLGRLKLVLERNNYLFFNQTQFRKLDSSGDQPASVRLENCYYQGTVSGDLDSFVALSSCTGLRGVIAFSNGTAYGIRPLDGSERARRHPHVLFKSRWPTEAMCGAVMPASSHERRHRKRRDASKQTKYVELAVVGDFELAKSLGLDEEDTFTHVLETVNTADLMLSRELNVRVSVIHAEVWLDAQRLELYEDAQRVLHGVVDYATGHLYNIAKDATIVITGASFAGAESATANFGSVCTARSAAIAKSMSPFHTHFSAQLATQALSHLLGLEHDSSSCRCAAGACVMAAHPGHQGAPFAWQFSKCSVARSHSVWAGGNVHCLLNKPFQMWELHECGNGVVDRGEECDCGSREQCQDPCCDALTCTLRPHAQCAAHQTCCYRCQVRRAGEVCRNSRGACDVAEVCDGISGDCPPDGHLIDGTACGEAGQCWRGNCSDQHTTCTKIWGAGARVAAEACFSQNVRGHEYANCGMGPNGPKPCEQADIRCGSLHCAGGSKSPPSSMKLNAFMLQFDHEGEQVECKTLSDPIWGISPDGTHCGTGRVCVAGSCVEASQVSARVECPTNNHALQCSGHGDCTTTANCVCFAGWSGKACDTRTLANTSSSLPGGSSIIVVPSIAVGRSLDTPTLLGILLLVGVILLLLLVCLLFCYRRRSMIEIPENDFDKDAHEFETINDANRSIKFGNMPSYREEKRKRKSNKLVYGALNRIQEAEERERESIRGSASIGGGSAHDLPTQIIYSNDRALGSREFRASSREHVYAESAIGIGYREVSTASPNRRHVLYSGSHDPFPLSAPAEWVDDSSPATATLKLSNIGYMLKQLGSNGSCSPGGSVASRDSGHVQATPLLTAPDTGNYGMTRQFPSDGETSGVEADHHSGEEVGSNAGSGKSNDSHSKPDRWTDECSIGCDTTSARHSFDFGAPPINANTSSSSQRLFSDSFKLEMTNSLHR